MVSGSPRVVISGYYGFDNLGDEAVLLSMLNALQEICPGMQPVVLSNNPSQTTELYGVQAVNRWSIREVYRAIAEADLVISGGGSLLQDVTGLKSLLYYLGVIWLALISGRPVVFYAQGIGPVRSRLGRWLIKLTVSRVKLITVRDVQSGEELTAMGIKKPRIHVTADPVLGLSIETVALEQGLNLLTKNQICVKKRSSDITNVSVHQPVAGIALRDWPGFGDNGKLVVARVGDDLYRRGWQVVFLPFHYPEDVAVCQRVSEMMQYPGLVIGQKLNVVEMASLIYCLDLLIGMRLHALVMAAVFEVPLIGISYDPKIDRFLEQLNLTPAQDVINLHYPVLQSVVNDVLSDLNGFKEKLSRSVYPLRKLARESAVLTLGVLKK